ncbi:hypothetical protein [Tengunoibacter tsumagoiensis]|uniref:F5/8 type C domain-containing protein n=1 Tax=Tengunoibacter tsumagoiensis TaxID=2014871 RepID=A0A402A815_9CHLR|nr:hypothetical protein [Tengunoibacter tsumagoiensis]GCE15121.1 hypothetical protein KTT_49800 [Tengunoibacter tsumagoiensis]
MDTSIYYGIYKSFYQTINYINQTLNPDIPLLVGGPTTGNDQWQYFLDTYKADTDPAKRLDFLSYHPYMFNGSRPNYGPLDYQNQYKGVRQYLDGLLAARGLSTGIPIIASEYGAYPVDSSNNRLMSTAADASIDYYFLDESNTYPIRFATRKDNEEGVEAFFNQFAIQPGKVTTQYNLMLMQSQMKTTRVAASSDSLDTHGFGVYGEASSDESGVSVMAWNYQSDRSIQNSYTTTINVNNLPAQFSGKNIRVQRYLIDATHSNNQFDASNSDLQQVEDTTLAPNSSFSETVSLGPNAMTQIILTSVSDSTGNTITDNLNDWSQLGTNGSHSDNWRFDASNGANFEGDTSRATRTSDSVETIVYNYTNISTFSARIYYFNGAASPIKFYISGDGRNWTPLSVSAASTAYITGNWTRSVFSPSTSFSSGTNYVKVEFSSDSNIWTPQLSQMTFTTG